MKGTSVMCPMDGYVVFRRSELLCGRLGKVTLGGSNKSGLFQVCYALMPSSTSYIHMNLVPHVFCTFAIPRGQIMYSSDYVPSGVLPGAALALICLFALRGGHQCL